MIKSWRSKLWLPKEYIEMEREEKEAGVCNGLQPLCRKCTKEKGYNVEVTAFGVKDFGKLPGEDGEHYTDFYARCHGEEDIFRIEGFRWDKMQSHTSPFDPEHVAHVAAMRKLPFFYEGSDATRVIPASVMRNFLASQRGSIL